jgi:DNA invertase Pin-like site-specific DNA recombinase
MFSNDKIFRELGTKPRAVSYVRWSTAVQSDGDSHRRQSTLAEKYAEAHGLDLVDEFLDAGKSAFRGRNLSEGALGLFLQAIREGTFGPGDHLLVESLDRISRAEPMMAMNVLHQIIEAEIIVVTLSDERVYRKPVGTGDIFYLVSVAVRAHEESQIKSKRIEAAWKGRRIAVKEGRAKASKNCPAWMKPKADKTGYDLIPERAAIVRKMFAMSIAGHGLYSIIKTLKREAVPPFNGKDWTPDRVRTIIYSPTTIGHYQPQRVGKNGRREIDGPVIKDAYPAVISEDDFYRSLAAGNRRTVCGRGRKGKKLSNLFGNIAFCAECGGKMYYDSARRKNPNSTLYCAETKAGTCTARRWHYDPLEESFLIFVREINLDDIISGNDSREARINAELLAMEGKANEVKAKIASVMKFAVAGKTAEAIAMGQIADYEKELEKNKARSDTLEAERREIAEAKERGKESFIAKFPDNLSDDDLYELRIKTAAQIKSVIERIELYRPKEGSEGLATYTVQFKGGAMQHIIADPANMEEPLGMAAKGFSGPVTDEILKIAKERCEGFAIS